MHQDAGGLWGWLFEGSCNSLWFISQQNGDGKKLSPATGTAAPLCSQLEKQHPTLPPWPLVRSAYRTTES